MTKDQFKEFVKKVIDNDPDKPDRFEREIDEIVEQWESDVNDARIQGQAEHDCDPYDYVPPCMGPCCGGDI